MARGATRKKQRAVKRPVLPGWRRALQRLTGTALLLGLLGVLLLGGRSLLSLPVERVGSWRSGGLTVVDEPLSAILRELSLRFDVRITLVDPGPGGNRLSVFYPEVDSLETVLADLATQQNLRYRRTSDGWELF